MGTATNPKHEQWEMGTSHCTKKTLKWEDYGTGTGMNGPEGAAYSAAASTGTAHVISKVESVERPARLVC